MAITDTAQAPVSLRPPLACVAQPAVLQGEKTADFETLLAGISSALRPADIFEEIWTRDMADLVWEVFRLRRLKAALMREDAYRGLVKVLVPRQTLVQGFQAVARDWACGNDTAAARIEAVFATAGVTMDAVHAKTMVLRIDEIERIDRMTMLAERRRDATLHEIDRHRMDFAQRLRRAVDAAEEAEFKVIAPDCPAPAVAAANGIAHDPDMREGVIGEGGS